MTLIFFLTGLSFEGLGLAAYLQHRQGGDIPLGRQLPCLALFGLVCGIASWIDMLLLGGGSDQFLAVLKTMRIIAQPLTGLLLLKFGWGILKELTPLPAWTIFIPGVLIVPIAYVITYAATTFITPSPVEIPIDIWSRYLLYLPGSVMAGIGFIRQWHTQKTLGLSDVASLMLGAGIGFLLEAFVVGLVVPAVPYGPASYYNYDRVIYNAFTGEQSITSHASDLMTSWLDYNSILQITGLPIQFWRMLSALTVTFFVVRGLDVFEAIRKMQLKVLQDERDRANRDAFNSQIAARYAAEKWTNLIVSINRRITSLEDVDETLYYIVDNARRLFRSNFMGLALLSDDYSALELRCFSSDGRSGVATSPMIVDNPLVLRVLQSAHAYRSSVIDEPEMFENICAGACQSMRVAAIVRLALDNRPFGALWVAKWEDKSYSETDLIWLECMADQAVISIQHGLMMSQLQSLSITEERSRIAREMHDGLAQVLGYLNLQTQTLEALLSQGKRDELRMELGQMRDSIRVAHADVRENILSLRTTLANNMGPVTAIGEYLKEFNIQTNVETNFVNNVGGDLGLSSVAEVQLVCVLQEALVNVRKHSNANKVEVLIAKEHYSNNDFVYLRIIDDGIGFEPHKSSHSFGLQTMRERAESVHGTLSIGTAPGKGTLVECRFPCLQQEKLKKKSFVLS